MAKRISKLLSLFRKRGLKPPTTRRSKQTLGGGHRGVAIGSSKTPDYSAENVEKWRSLPAEAVEGFVYNQEPLFVHSTNVKLAQYFIDEHKLMVEFRDGDSYLYSDVTEDEAIRFAKAQSKGSEIWDTFRVRGTKLGHKKPYTKIAGGYRPSERQSEETEIDGIRYEVIREAGGGVRYRIID